MCLKRKSQENCDGLPGEEWEMGDSQGMYK